MTIQVTKTVSVAASIERQTLQDILTGLNNRSHGLAGLVIKVGGSALAKTANTLTFCINGKAYSVAAGDVTMAGAVQAISTICAYLVTVNSAGTFAVTAGNPIASGGTPVLPDFPANSAPVGYVTITTDATHTYTPATTALDAAGITAAYVDLNTVVTA